MDRNKIWEKILFLKNGKMAKGKIKINGVTYDFGTNGVLNSNSDSHSGIKPGQFHMILHYWNDNKDVVVYLDNKKVLDLSTNDNDSYVDIFVSKGFHYLKAVNSTGTYKGSFYISTEMIKNSKTDEGLWILSTRINYDKKILTNLEGGDTVYDTFEGGHAWITDSEKEKILKTTHDIYEHRYSPTISVDPGKISAVLDLSCNPFDGTTATLPDKFKGNWYYKDVYMVNHTFTITDYCAYDLSNEYACSPLYYTIEEQKNNTVVLNSYLQKNGILIAKIKLSLSKDGKKLTMYQEYRNGQTTLVLYRKK